MWFTSLPMMGGEVFLSINKAMRVFPADRCFYRERIWDVKKLVLSAMVLTWAFLLCTQACFAANKVDVIRLAGGDYGYLSPYTHYMRGPGSYKMSLIFDGLLEHGDKGLIPWLAESWTIEANGKSYRFKLRPDVKWHDGQPFTAEDVAFTLNYIKKFPPVSNYVGQDDVEKVEVINPLEVKVTLKDPSVPMLMYLGRVRMMPKHIWQDVDRPNEFTDKKAVIGTGPYRLTAYSKEHGTYRFEAWDGFWGPEPRVKAIEFIPVSDEMLSLQKGELDLANIKPDVKENFLKRGWTVAESPAVWGYRFVMNMKDYPELGDVRVRRALAFCIDSEELIRKIGRGAGKPGNYGILPPDHMHYNPDVADYPLDREKAGALLDEAGYAGKNEKGIRLGPDGKPFTLEILADERTARLAEMLRQQIAKADIDVKVRVIDRKSRDAAVVKGQFQTAVIGHGGWGRDADYLRERFVAGVSKSISSASSSNGYHNDRLAALLEQQRQAFDPEKRKALLFEAQAILADEVPDIPLFYPIYLNCYRVEKYDGWMYMYDHHNMTHGKLSYLDWR